MLNFLLNFDQQLTLLFTNYGTWTYAILFLIIFFETGCILTAFLPGDSLLFAVGLIGPRYGLPLPLIAALLILAAILGNTVNYWVGRFLHKKIAEAHHLRFVKMSHLHDARDFYEKYGPKAIVIGLFIPIIRTFVPLIAGVARMNPLRYQLWNIIGSVLWIGGVIYVSHFFSNVPLIKNNFSAIVGLIILVSLLPVIIKLIQEKLASKKS